MTISARAVCVCVGVCVCFSPTMVRRNEDRHKMKERTYRNQYTILSSNQVSPKCAEIYLLLPFYLVIIVIVVVFLFFFYFLVNFLFVCPHVCEYEYEWGGKKIVLLMVPCE